MFKVIHQTFVGVSATTLGAAFINALISKVIDTKTADVQIGDDCINVYFEQCKGSKKVRNSQMFRYLFSQI